MSELSGCLRDGASRARTAHALAAGFRPRARALAIRARIYRTVACRDPNPAGLGPYNTNRDIPALGAGGDGWHLGAILRVCVVKRTLYDLILPVYRTTVFPASRKKRGYGIRPEMSGGWCTQRAFEQWVEEGWLGREVY